MNTEFFIAKRILQGRKYTNKISRPVITITIIGIALGFAAMICSLAVVTGFQSEIRDKVIGFGSHIQVQAFNAKDSYESSPIPIDQPFYPSLKELDGVRHIQIYAIKPGIIQSPGDTVESASEPGGFKVERDILGIAAKGIGEDFDWEFFEDKIVEGKHFVPDDSVKSDEILISQFISDQLNLSTGQEIDVYFITGDKPSKRKFTISGIYETGMEEFDKEIAFVDIRYIQELNNWGVSTFLELVDTCHNGEFLLHANTRGGNGNYAYDWGEGWTSHEFQVFCPEKDTTIRVVSSDRSMELPGSSKEEVILSYPDTAWLRIDVSPRTDTIPTSCDCDLANGESIYVEFLEEGRIYKTPKFVFNTRAWTSGGSSKYYTGGFEVLIDEWEDLDRMHQFVDKEHIGPNLKANTIRNIYPEIFSWLEMLDINVIIIVVLMIAVAVINMSSALLVLILERTNMIGILKAMGAKNWSIRKVFLYNAAYLIGKGLLWGNLFGLGLLILQDLTGIFTLNQATYYVNTVPVNINVIHILLLNLGTLLVCTAMLIVPSFIITRIAPVKAIRFN